METYVFTCGDINGIGPEICVKTFNKIYNPSKFKIIFFCPAEVFETELEKSEEQKFDYRIINKPTAADYSGKDITIFNIGKAVQKFGSPTIASGKICYKAIKESFKLVSNLTASAMITAPISKIALNKTNINYPGHTELLAELCGIKKYSMMFVSHTIKAGLVTTHEPIKNIPKLITKRRIINTIKTIHDSLVNDFNLKNPTIAMLGLNPHAGEEGKIGKEEKTIIKPALEYFDNEFIEGPFVPDAFFGKREYQKYDAIIGMYHDQILIPFKLLNFERGVNFTAGLPIIRTSPDHGTAFDIAGTGKADYQSFYNAFKVAKQILKNRKTR